MAETKADERVDEELQREINRENATFETLLADKTNGMRAFVARSSNPRWTSSIMVGSNSAGWECRLVCRGGDYAGRARGYVERYNCAAARELR